MKALSSLFGTRSRYARSINLERDLGLADHVDGYIPTRTALDLLGRILAAETTPNASRSWTITGVYGTGKSAFSLFLAALHAPGNSEPRKTALRVLRRHEGAKTSQIARSSIPNAGFVRAVAVGRREPIIRTILRALARGGHDYWGPKPGPNPSVLTTIEDVLARDDRDLDGSVVVELTRQLAIASKAGLLLILDELGKPLERAAEQRSASDLYILQQLAELPTSARTPPVVVVSVLHQSFSDYGRGLTGAERAEWDKIHGRFEDVVFADSADQVLRLIGDAIEVKASDASRRRWGALSRAWAERLDGIPNPYVRDLLTSERIFDCLPLHPITAVALPELCAKYAQNHRSLFTFLTSEEQHSFRRFMSESFVVDDTQLPLINLDRVYDYFVDVVGLGLSARPHYQRWAEIHSAVREAHGLPGTQLKALKTIGALNLISSTGALRAGKDLVVASLVQDPTSTAESDRWRQVVSELEERGLVTYRSQIDELRLWQGSEFNVEDALRRREENDRRHLAEVLATHVSLPPFVAERHSYRTGCLRILERRFVGNASELRQTETEASHADGCIIFWVGNELPDPMPSRTREGSPLVVVAAGDLSAVSSAAREYAGLAELRKNEGVLKTDPVARREVQYRLAGAKRHLDERLREAFDLRLRSAGERQARCWINGELWAGRNFNAALSAACDEAYGHTPVLWNELLNRNALTSQGARAQRELIEALILQSSTDRLGLEGYGPEVSMYESVFRATGIHRRAKGSDAWEIGPPRKNSGLYGVWRAIEVFFDQSTTRPRSLDLLYDILRRPPYGAKEGLIPVLIAATLVHRSDDVTLYREGSFIPQLGPELFEVLVKQPDKYSVKHFELSGIRWELFRELEAVLQAGRGAKASGRNRNATLLSVVRPLVRFATQLPRVTLQSSRISETAFHVKEALTSATEPDRLIFEALPEACGFEPFLTDHEEADGVTPSRHIAFKHALLTALRELQGYYDRLLSECLLRVGEALVPGDTPVRDSVQIRAQALVDKCLEPQLKRFLIAVGDAEASDRDWIQAVAMVTADRPPENWRDEDLLRFEAKLSELSRRFLHLESLHLGSIQAGRNAFEARRVSITRPDGTETHELVWLDRRERDLIRATVDDLVGRLEEFENDHSRNAVALALVERLWGATEEISSLQKDNVESESQTKPANRKKRGHG